MAATSTIKKPATKKPKPAKIKKQIKLPDGSNGGPRPGAGRPKGALNKKTRAMQELVSSTGDTPLQFMLKVMRGEACPADASPQEKAVYAGLRFEAAKASAPYIHARLSSIELAQQPEETKGDGKLSSDPIEAAKQYKDIMG